MENQMEPPQVSVPEQSPQSQTEPPHKTDSRSGMYFVLAIALTVIALGGLYFYIRQVSENVNTETPVIETPTDEFADWQTYRNDKYEFELKYPESWQLSEMNLDSGDNPFIVLGNPLEGLQVYPIYIFIHQNNENLSPEAFVNNLLAEAPKEGPGGIIFEDKYPVTAGNLQGYELYKVFAFDKHEERVYLGNGKFIYQISYPVAEDNPNLSSPTDNNKTAKQILSTFKFTK